MLLLAESHSQGSPLSPGCSSGLSTQSLVDPPRVSASWSCTQKHVATVLSTSVPHGCTLPPPTLALSRAEDGVSSGACEFFLEFKTHDSHFAGENITRHTWAQFILHNIHNIVLDQLLT